MSLSLTNIRAQFPILSNQDTTSYPLIYLDSAATTQKPQQVIDAIARYYSRHNANVHRSLHNLANESSQAIDGVRTKVHELLNSANKEEIIFTAGTTDSINLIADAYVEPLLTVGDEVLVSVMEHHSNLLPWQKVCKRKGAHLRIIPINEQGEVDLDRYVKMLSPRTKIVAITHASNVTGTLNPIQQITEMAHQYPARVIVDAAQTAGHLLIDVQQIDCDFLAFSAHKMYGPTGVGVLYGKKELLAKCTPTRLGGGMVQRFQLGQPPTYERLPYRLEAGTPNLAGIFGLGVAIDFLQEIGYPNIHTQEQRLLAYSKEELRKINGLQHIGNPAKQVGLLSFVIPGIHPLDIAMELDLCHIAVRSGQHCAQPLMQAFNVDSTVRISFGIYNDLQEVDLLVATLHRMIKKYSH